MDIEAQVRARREQGAEAWRAAVAQGVRPGAPLAVDLFFYADSESPARLLCAELAELTGSPVRCTPHRRRQGLLRRSVVLWAVQATVRERACTLETIGDLTEDMVRRAARLGVEFDGWGAQVPSGA